jgi:hypothetical protein
MLDARAQAAECAIRKPPGLARGGRTLARKADSSKGGTFSFVRGASTSARGACNIARAADGLEGGVGWVAGGDGSSASHGALSACGAAQQPIGWLRTVSEVQ